LNDFLNFLVCGEEKELATTTYIGEKGDDSIKKRVRNEYGIKKYLKMKKEDTRKLKKRLEIYKQTNERK